MSIASTVLIDLQPGKGSSITASNNFARCAGFALHQLRNVAKTLHLLQLPLWSRRHGSHRADDSEAGRRMGFRQSSCILLLANPLKPLSLTLFLRIATGCHRRYLSRLCLDAAGHPAQRSKMAQGACGSSGGKASKMTQ